MAAGTLLAAEIVWRFCIFAGPQEDYKVKISFLQFLYFTTKVTKLFHEGHKDINGKNPNLLTSKSLQCHSILCILSVNPYVLCGKNLLEDFVILLRQAICRLYFPVDLL